MRTLNFILAATAMVAIVGCSSDEYVGANAPDVAKESAGAIGFGSNANRMLRATKNSGTTAEMLDGQFKVYGVKDAGSSQFADVFTDYVVWSANGATTSNPDADWEYVGGTSVTYGEDATPLGAEQYIKYWDYSAANYHFVAGSPVANFTYALNAQGDIATATVTGLAGHIAANTGTAITTNPVYIADPVNVPKSAYQQDVNFQFTRQQSFVRVGVFETIPGYKITDIKFYTYDASDWSATAGSENIVLASKTADYFTGATAATATVTYDWTGATPTYTFAYTTGLTTAKNWYGGKMNSATFEMATSSTEPTVAKLYGADSDMGDNGYFTVIPSASALGAQPIFIKCDYTLTALDGSETIKVSGATAAIPATFALWKPNTTYTYLFKISDNTNGTTGTPGTDPEGLFPITFDAVVMAEADGNKEGIITTVSTPSITTYQAGSVVTAGIKYVANKPIYFTAQNDETGALNTLASTAGVGYVEVVKLAGAVSEADLQLAEPTGTNLATVGAAAATVGKFTLPAGQHASFTPDAAGYYAIKYQTAAAVGTTPAAYAYKVVHVE